MYWIVDFPTHQYNEDVKALASASGLRILDRRHAESVDPSLVESNTPTITKVGEKKKRKPRKKKAEKTSDSE